MLLDTYEEIAWAFMLRGCRLIWSFIISNRMIAWAWYALLDAGEMPHMDDIYLFRHAVDEALLE